MAKHLHNNLRFLRERRNLKQSEMKAAINIKPTTWNNYETGTSQPGLDALIEISKYFGVSEMDLLHNDLEANAHLIGKTQVVKIQGNAHPNAHPNAHLKYQKEINELRKECDLKAIQIAEKQHLIDVQKKLIESLEATIKTLRKGSPQSTYTARRSTKDGHPAHKRSSNT